MTDGSDDGGNSSWNDLYRGDDSVPWDTGRPQSAVVDLVEAGAVGGRILDAGCGAGTEALFLAERGYDVVGVDSAAVAIDRARDRAERRRPVEGSVSFARADATDLPGTDFQSFDVAIDCGLLHALEAGRRRDYTDSLASVLDAGGRTFVLAFGPDAPEDWGPTPVSATELRASFGDRWLVDRVESAGFETRQGTVPAVLGVVERV